MVSISGTKEQAYALAAWGLWLNLWKGGLNVKSPNVLIGLSIMFFVFAVALSVTMGNDVSLAVKIGLFVCGFGSGAAAGRRSATPA